MQQDGGGGRRPLPRHASPRWPPAKRSLALLFLLVLLVLIGICSVEPREEERSVRRSALRIHYGVTETISNGVRSVKRQHFSQRERNTVGLMVRDV